MQISQPSCDVKGQIDPLKDFFHLENSLVYLISVMDIYNMKQN